MHLLSPSSSSKSPQFPLFSPSPSPNHPKFFSKIPIRSVSSSHLLKLLPNSSKSSSPSLQPSLLISEDSDDEELQEKSKEEFGEQNKGEFYGKKVSGKLLVVRRPVLEIASEETDDSVKETTKDGEIKREEDQNPSSTTSSSSSSSTSSSIELGLSKIAKKMPMFEPERVNAADMEKPLGINLELALYRAKVLARKFQFDEAEKILRKCISIWPEDGRPYVALGKILSKQSKMTEARSVYETGCQATQGENAYIWQCWAVLENKNGNVRRARELFDAATVADKKHIAAWHGWAILEIKQGNIKKARNLLGKGLKYCGGNEYVYQTLALLEAKANRIEQARYLFRQATLCNPKSCASWLAWAQIEMRQENHRAATKLFEKAVQASPKNRFAWHVWGIFEASKGDIEKGRKLLKIGHALNPRDPVLLQSLALLEYQHSSANLARVLFRRASELDPRHQPVWIAWGWMEWKEGNIITARELYQRALSIDSTSESAARCLQAWGVLEQRIGNLSAARRLFRSSLNINSQSYVTWMTWASLEEEQGNSVRAEEIRNLYFQQRTEVVDDASWVMGFLDIIDPALDSIMRLLNLDSNSGFKGQNDALRNNNGAEEFDENNKENNDTNANASDFDLDGFLKDKLSLDPSKLDAKMEMFEAEKKTKSTRQIWKSGVKTVTLPSS